MVCFVADTIGLPEVFRSMLFRGGFASVMKGSRQYSLTLHVPNVFDRRKSLVIELAKATFGIVFASNTFFYISLLKYTIWQRQCEGQYRCNDLCSS